jgi:hypothetical protein
MLELFQAFLQQLLERICSFRLGFVLPESGTQVELNGQQFHMVVATVFTKGITALLLIKET